MRHWNHRSFWVAVTVILLGCSGKAENTPATTPNGGSSGAAGAGAGGSSAAGGVPTPPSGGAAAGESSAAGASHQGGTAAGESGRSGGSDQGGAAAGTTGGRAMGGGGGTDALGLCTESCGAPVAACIGRADGTLIDSDLTFMGRVTRSAADDTGPMNRECFGFLLTDAVRVEITDASAATWVLSFPRAQVGPDHFTEGTVVNVVYQRRSQSLPFIAERLLTVHEDGELSLFFEQSRGPSAFAISGLDLERQAGEDFCRTTRLAFCDAAQALTRVSDGAQTLTNPCKQAIGGFAVTSNYFRYSGRDCDKAHEYRAAGTRLR